MKFYHSTVTPLANKIIRTQKMKPSDFDVWEFLSYTIDIYEYNKSERLPMTYPGLRGDLSAYWLGKGIYCYKETDLESARKHNEMHDAIVEIITDDELEYIDLSNPENKRIMISFLENEFVEFLDKGNFTQHQKESYELIRKILLKSVKEDHIKFPHAAGIVLELYTFLLGKKYQLASANFVLNPADKVNIREEEYFVIKDSKVIKEITYAP